MDRFVTRVNIRLVIGRYRNGSFRVRIGNIANYELRGGVIDNVEIRSAVAGNQLTVAGADDFICRQHNLAATGRQIFGDEAIRLRIVFYRRLINKLRSIRAKHNAATGTAYNNRCRATALFRCINRSLANRYIIGIETTLNLVVNIDGLTGNVNTTTGNPAFFTVCFLRHIGNRRINAVVNIRRDGRVRRNLA